MYNYYLSNYGKSVISNTHHSSHIETMWAAQKPVLLQTGWMRLEPAKIAPSGKITVAIPLEQVVYNRGFAAGPGLDAVVARREPVDPSGFALNPPRIYPWGGLVRRHRMRTTLLTVAVLASLASTCALAIIPNPLIRPAPIAKPETIKPAAAAPPEMRMPPPPPAMGRGPMPGGGGGNSGPDLNEIRKHLAGLRVIAVAGSHAVLRVEPLIIRGESKSSGTAAVSGTANSANGGGDGSDNLPLYSTMYVNDADILSMAGHHLHIRIRDEAISMATDGGDLVYSGMLSPSYATPASIDLEKRDGQYVQTIQPAATGLSGPASPTGTTVSAPAQVLQ